MPPADKPANSPQIDLDAIRERDAASAETWFKPSKDHHACARAIQDRRALLAEVDRTLQNEREGWRYARELEEERKRLRTELEIVTRDRDTLLQMTGKTIEQVAAEITRLRLSPPQD